MRGHKLAAIALVLAGAVAVTFALGAGGKAKSGPAIIPLEEIQPGMKGHGMTVFSGTEPERFDVEVISVMRDFLPKQDLILARCSHPVLDHAGVIAGMSGSPVYLDGRLAGAVAYAWRFAKDPIAGITPASSMTAYLDMPSLPPGIWGGSSGPIGPGAGTAAGQPPSFWDRFDSESAQMVPLATPVTGGGPLWGSFLEALEPVLRHHFMIPTPVAQVAGGKAKAPAKAVRFRPGDSIAVQLVGGDLDMAATGTVTVVEGPKALGFGHPMFNWGEVRMPAATAVIHHCLASESFSFKMSETRTPLGSIVQDRQAGIMADMDEIPDTVSLDVKLRDKTRGMKQTWHMDVAQHPQLTPGLVRSALTSAVDHFALDVVDTVADGSFRVEVEGHDPLEFAQKVFLSNGTYNLAYSQKLSDVLMALMLSDFEAVNVDKVEVDLDLEYGHDVAVIAGAYASCDEVEEGDTVRVWVILKPHRFPKMTLGFDLEVPGGSAGKDLTIDIKPGGRVPPDVAPPQDLDDVIENLGKGYPDDKIVAVVQVPTMGVSIEGQQIMGLPLSAMSTLQPQIADLGQAQLAVLDRYFLSTPYILEGETSLKMKVKGK